MHDPDDTNVLSIDPELFQFMGRLAPGVLGYSVEHNGALYVPFITAENPGTGHVRAYLDSLPRDRLVRFPTVINGILRAALERRGFTSVWDWSDDLQAPVEYLERGPTT